MPKISVIMPSLNVAAYMRECMDSVVGQTLEDLEILCIDAGSTDGTWEILEEYAGKDARIRLIKSDKKSYGYQMNIGLNAAKGEYIGIVETDDFILPEMFEELYACAKEQDADFVKSDFDVFTTFPDGERFYLRYPVKTGSSVEYDRIFTAADYMESMLSIDVFIWNGIYKKEFLRNNHIRFQETPGAAFQDCGFRYQIALCVQRGYFLPRSFYRYRRDNVSSSTYNSRSVLYNLSECRNLLREARQRGAGKEQMEFLAREIAVIAHRPYIELLTWSSPAKGTKEALEEFRVLLKGFMEQGILNGGVVTEEMWLEIKMFVERPKLYEKYAHLKAQVKAENLREFLEMAAAQKEIILFGSGYKGACIYCLLRNNGVNHIAAFSDNNREKWGSFYLGHKVEAPEDAVKNHQEALFLIVCGGYSVDVQKQLRSYGVPRERILIYRLTDIPMDCTNMVMRVSNENTTSGVLQLYEK